MDSKGEGGEDASEVPLVAQASQTLPGEPSAKKPRFESPKFLKTGSEAVAGGRQPGTPKTPRVAREVSPSNALLSMTGRQMAKREQEAHKEEERRKRAENEELLKAQRKAARQAALEHKEEESRSPEELVNQVVWAKVGTYHWWPAQIVDPTKINMEPRLSAERKSETEVLTRFFGTYDYAWVERRTNVSDLDHKYGDRKKLTKKKAFLRALEEAETCRKTGALPDPWTTPLEEEPQPEEVPLEEPPEADGILNEAPLPEPKAANERKRKGKAHVEEDQSKAARKARQLRIMRYLGLAPPEGSPFMHGIVA